MMRRKTNLSKQCDICIGCGRCTEAGQDICVITEAPEAFGEGKRNKNQWLVAVDMGTTTIAMQLYDDCGSLQDSYVQVNPQTEYGADVLSRISAAENIQDAQRMREQVLEVLKQGIEAFQKKAEQGVSLKMVMAANTTMVYLLMGWNPAELGQTPFYASHLEAVETKIAQVSCYIFPGASAFVGGDIVAGVLATDMYRKEEISLLIDLGTNGEMVLGNCKKLIACSTAAGPAFEGGVNRGIWGADMVAILAKLRKRGIVDETGLLQSPYFEKGVRIGDVCVTQEAIRSIQLAKGAIAAGIQILTEEYGITIEQIDKVVLAGGFGYYLKPDAAAQIGLLPKALVGKTVSGGNTALAGACRLGMLGNSSEEVEQISRNIQVLNLAENPSFYERYLSAMNLTEN